jgi:hypothetical protein
MLESIATKQDTEFWWIAAEMSFKRVAARGGQKLQQQKKSIAARSQRQRSSITQFCSARLGCSRDIATPRDD